MDPITTNPPWAVPGVAVDLPRAASGPVSVDVASLDAPPPGTRPLPGSPVDRLQPRTVSQLLDGGFEVVRFRVRAIAAVAAVLFLPLYAVPTLLTTRLIGSTSRNPFSFLTGQNAVVSSTGEVTSGFWDLLAYALIGQVGMMIARMLLGVALAHLVTSWMTGRDPSIRATLRHVARRSFVALAAMVVLIPVKVVSALPLYVGLIYTLPVFAVLAPVVSVEGAGAFRSIGRTHSMSVRRYGPFLGMWALWLLVSAAMTQTLAVLLQLVFDQLLDGFVWSWLPSSALTIGFAAVMATVEVAVWSLAYVDLRIRTEGIDIAFEIDEEFDRGRA